MGISSSQTVFLGRPRLGHRRGGRLGRPRTRPDLAAGVRAYTVAQAAKAQPRWRPISWRNRRGGRRWTVQCVALRVTPAHDWRDRRLAPEVWLLAERDTGATPRTKYFFVNLPATTSWPQLVRLAHQRWAIEQQYQELKTHLGDSGKPLHRKRKPFYSSGLDALQVERPLSKEVRGGEIRQVI